MTKQTQWYLVGLLVVVLLVFGTTLLVLAQAGEPMANPDCAADQLGEVQGQIDQYYTDAQTALRDGDVRGWLDNLQSISRLTSSLRAFCDGYVFEGDAEGSESQVIGPIVFEPGVYIVTATTDGFMLVHIEDLSESCGTLTMGLSEGEATEGAQQVFRVDDEPCNALLEISNLTADWRVEFSAVAAGS